MANRWKGNFVVATAATSSGTDYTGKANGAWGLNSQLQQKQANLWARAVSAPSAPTIGTATAGNAQATVTFTAPSDTGGGTITSYTATSTPGSITGSSATSPITVTGLNNGTAYTFKVKATNSFGTGVESAASNSVTPNSLSSISICGNTTPFTQTYTWASGFGTKYANPSTLPTTYCYGVAYNSTNSAVAIGSNSTYFSEVYAWNLTTGYGTKYSSSTASLGSTGNAVTFNRDSTVISFALGLSPCIKSFAWSNSSGFGSVFSDPASLPAANTGTSVTTTSSGASYIAVSGMSTFAVYPLNSTSYGTKLTTPSPFSESNTNCVAFSPDNSVISIGTSAGAFLSMYPFSAGFGTKYADPATALPGSTNQQRFTPDGNNIIAASNATPFISAYPWNNLTGFGTKYANPSTLAAASYSMDISSTGTDIVIGGFAAPFVNAYPWNNGFGTKYANPSTTAISASGLAFSN